MNNNPETRIAGFRLPAPGNRVIWLLLAFLLKGIIFGLSLTKNADTFAPGFIGIPSGDAPSYTKPIENLVDHGSYYPDHRMPGYGVFYYPAYLLFERGTALNVVIFLQYILAALATYILALSARQLFGSDKWFYLTFIIYGISTYSNLFDVYLLTESFATSFLIFAFYLFMRFTRENHITSLVLSGLCVTEVIFLRPVFFPLLFLFLVALLIHLRRNKMSLAKPALLFLLPFILIDGCWVARNYYLYRDPAPLTRTLYYPGTDNTVFYYLAGFLQSWGGSIVHWETGSELRWFGYGSRVPFGKGVDRTAVIPDYIYTSAFNEDSLLLIREKTYALLHDTTLSETTRQQYFDFVSVRLKNYSNSIRKEKPQLYYVKAPLKFAKTFFIHSGTYNLFQKSLQELSPVETGVKWFYSIFYIVVLVAGTCGIILLIKPGLQEVGIMVVTGIILYTGLVHPLILRFSEARYFIPAWPFMIICAIYCFNSLYKYTTGNFQKNDT